MKKIIWFMLFMLWGLSNVEAGDIPDHISKILHSVTVKVWTVGQGFCSGVIIENEDEANSAVILTAKHCVSVSEETYVDNNLVDFIVVSGDDDLACMYSRYIPLKNAAVMSPYRSRIGDLVYHLGFPPSGEILSSGYVENVTKDWQYGSFLVEGGCSGGGVFNKDGKLVGILWGKNRKYFGDEGRGIFEGLTDVRKFLKLIGQSYIE